MQEQLDNASFQGLLLTYRGRSGITQRQLAERAGVNQRSIQAWEAGASVPNAESLVSLIRALSASGGLADDDALAEAEALWSAAERQSIRQLPPFDRAWMAGVIGQRRAASTRSVPSQRQAASPPSLPADNVHRAPGPTAEWGDAPLGAVFVGRLAELQALKRWIVHDRARLVAVLGLGGIGKTALAARIAEETAPGFERVYWASLRNATPFLEWSGAAIGFLSEHKRLLPDGEARRMAMLLELLRERRCLLVLDNLEAVFQPRTSGGAYRPGCEAFGDLLRMLGDSEHLSCVLLTSREAPTELARLGGQRSLTFELELGGFGIDDARVLLADKQLHGDDRTWQTLVDRYGGNSLALKVVGETIHTVFAGDIAAFSDEAGSGTVFAGIRRLLESQIERLPAPEQEVLLCLAVEREPLTFAALAAGLSPRIGRAVLLEALEDLRRRSLLERAEPAGSFALPPVVLEYVTDELLERGIDEIERGDLISLARWPLVKAQAKDYVRRSQERLIAEPLLERLVGRAGDQSAAERHLVVALDRLRTLSQEAQGVGPGNLVNLLRLLRGNLRSTDLSGLRLRHVFLQEVEAQDATLAQAELAQAILADAFSYPTCVALSADGAYLAAGTTTGEVCVWRLADRTLVATLRGHSGLVGSVALSSDGRIVASSSEDGTVRVWDLNSTRTVCTVRGRDGDVRGVALSGDGSRVAAGSHTGSIEVWESDSGRVVASSVGDPSGVRVVALSRDSGVLASGGMGGTIQVWNVNSPDMQELSTLTGHSGPIWSIALNANGEVAASGSVDQTVRTWNTHTGENLAILTGHTGAVWGVALTEDGAMVTSASFDGSLKIWDSATGQLLSTLQGHTAGVRGVAVSGDGQMIASCSFDGTLRIWSFDKFRAPSTHVREARLLTTLRGHTSGVRGVALSGDGRVIASGSYDGTVRLWSKAGHLFNTLQAHTSGVWSVALSWDAERLASGSFDGTIKVWQTTTGKLLTTVRGQRNEVWGVALSGDGRLLASGSYSGLLRIWDASTGGLLTTVRAPHSGGVWGVAFTGERHILASGGEDGTVKLWEADTGRLLNTLHGHTGGVWGVALSGTGRYVASAGEDGTVRVWDTEQTRAVAILRGHTGGVWSVAISHDGALVASGSFDGLVRLWSGTSGQLLRTMAGHVSAVWSVAVSADNSLIASGSFDGSVKLWDAQTGESLRTMRPDRRYERMDITGLTGVTDAQREALVALGAVDHGQRLR